MISPVIGLYVINLDERQDRLNSFREQISGSSLKINRVSGVSSTSLVVDEKDSPAGVIACWKSHQKAYKLLIESENSHAVIFEDDAIIDKKLLNWLENLKPNYFDRIDLFQIGYEKSRYKLDIIEFDPAPFNFLDLRRYIGVELARLDLIYRNWIKISRFCVLATLIVLQRSILAFTKFDGTKFLNYIMFLKNERKLRKRLKINNPLIYHSFEAGSHAYVISRELASVLLNFNVPVLLPTDVCLMGIARAKNFRILRTSKTMSKQSGSVSSIISRTRV